MVKTEKLDNLESISSHIPIYYQNKLYNRKKKQSAAQKYDSTYIRISVIF